MANLFRVASMRQISDLVTTGAIVAVEDIVVEAVIEGGGGTIAADNEMPQKQAKKGVIMRTIKINQKQKKNNRKDHQVDTEVVVEDEAVDSGAEVEVVAVEAAPTTADDHAAKVQEMNILPKMRDIATKTVTITEMLIDKVEIDEDAVVAAEDPVATDGAQDDHHHKVPATKEINQIA